jgi:hypothetical protein
MGGIETSSWDDRAMPKVGMEAWEQRSGSARASDARICWGSYGGGG